MSALREVVSSFDFAGDFISIEPIIRGNINDTYIVSLYEQSWRKESLHSSKDQS